MAVPLSCYPIFHLFLSACYFPSGCFSGFLTKMVEQNKCIIIEIEEQNSIVAGTEFPNSAI